MCYQKCSAFRWKIPSIRKNTLFVTFMYPFFSYTVDMTLGMCSCEVGKDGSLCKHQCILWSANIGHCINFVPVTQPDVRQKLAWIAIGESLPLSHYNTLRPQDSQDNEGCEALPVSELSNADVQTLQSEDCLAIEIPEQPMTEDNKNDSQDTCIASAAELLSKSCDRIAEKLRNTRDPNLAKAIIKFSRRVTTLTTSTMHSNLTTALFNFGSGELKKTGKGKKIRVQPNRKRKSGNGNRQAVSKGRPTQLQQSLQVPPKKAKRSHDLAKAVQANTQSSRKSGSHTMKSKTRHVQRKR